MSAGIYLNGQFVTFATLRADATDAMNGNVGLFSPSVMAEAIVRLLDYIETATDVETHADKPDTFDLFDAARRAQSGQTL